MVVVKTLTYRQFSFLLSMSAARSGSVGSSSDVGSTGSQTPLSSEMSEVRCLGKEKKNIGYFCWHVHLLSLLCISSCYVIGVHMFILATVQG
ncbi:hypothetical protein E2C01_095892 [Portunus trituberculatus]|uniref:Uncharacterized protein n=1 Tax=Portunus trituberculatus TaxID=210409 RepID=A0A5B7JU77_PORTR|nr:hypothetical protein [Portunus trituberculatus]